MEVGGKLHSRVLYPQSGTHWTEDWVCPTASPDAVAKKKKSLHFSCRESSPGHPVQSIVTIVTELHDIGVATKMFHATNFADISREKLNK